MVLDCIEEHAPIKRVSLTRPVDPWMKDESIVNLKTQLKHHRNKARLSKEENDKKNYQATRNLQKWQNLKEVWSTVNHILAEQQTRIQQHSSDLNNYFTTLASKLTNKENAPPNLPDITSMQENSNGFTIQHANYDKIKEIVWKLKNDCSSGYGIIPVQFINPASYHLSSPLVYTINNSMDKIIFPNSC